MQTFNKEHMAVGLNQAFQNCFSVSYDSSSVIKSCKRQLGLLNCNAVFHLFPVENRQFLRLKYAIHFRKNFVTVRFAHGMQLIKNTDTAKTHVRFTAQKLLYVRVS